LTKSDCRAMSSYLDYCLPTHPCSSHVTNGCASDAVISLPWPPNDFTEGRQHIGKLVLPDSPLLLVHHVSFIVRVEPLALVSRLGEEGTVVTLRKEREVEADNLPRVEAASEDLEWDDTMAVAVGALRLIFLSFRQDFPET
jgi:hypothetical protein